MNSGYIRWPREKRNEVESSALSRRSSIQRVEILHPDESGFRMTRGWVGFTLIEMLIVIGVIAILLSLLVPALQNVRKLARDSINIGNQHTTTQAMLIYTANNRDDFAPTINTSGDARTGRMTQSNLLKRRFRSRRDYPYGAKHSSLSGYYGSEIKNPTSVICPNLPVKFDKLQEIWDAGDYYPNYEGPYNGQDTEIKGSYCFYPNYIGYLKDRNKLFEGPRDTQSRRGESSLIMTDYFGSNYYQFTGGYGSCEELPKSECLKRTPVSVDIWHTLTVIYWGDSPSPELLWSAMPLEEINVKLHGSYTDGHVDTYYPWQTEVMYIWDRINGQPYINNYGEFYVPRKAIY